MARIRACNSVNFRLVRLIELLLKMVTLNCAAACRHELFLLCTECSVLSDSSINLTGLWASIGVNALTLAGHSYVLLLKDIAVSNQNGFETPCLHIF